MRVSPIFLAAPDLATPLHASNAARITADYLRAGARPEAASRVGLEMEVLGYERASLRRIGPDTVERLMRWFAAEADDVDEENGVAISVHAGWGNITLEPGGQIEFSGWPHDKLAGVRRDLERFLDLLRACARELDVTFIACGFDPLRSLDDQRWIAKQRYEPMRPFLAARGRRAWDMMTRTAALQVSVDYRDERHMMQTYALGNRLGPIVAALFARSPFEEGRPNGLLSTRYAVWLETDDERCGIGPPAFDGAPSLARFVDYALCVPPIFIKGADGARAARGSRLLDEGEMRLGDFDDLISTIFTDARIRFGYVEMRSADSGGVDDALALAALWKALAYDAAAASAALRLAPRLPDAGAWRDLRRSVAERGLHAGAHGVEVAAIAAGVVDAARDGLGRVAPDEVPLLEPLVSRLRFMKTAAEELLELTAARDVFAAFDACVVA